MRLVDFTYEYPMAIRGKFQRYYLPEAQLVSLVVVATKLFFPFDSIERYPRSLDDPAAQVLDWDLWVEAQKKYDSRGKTQGGLSRSDAIEATEADALQMTEQQLDDYMDWYDKMWIADKGKHHFQTSVLNSYL